MKHPSLDSCTCLKINCKKHGKQKAMAVIGGGIYCEKCLKEYWRAWKKLSVDI